MKLKGVHCCEVFVVLEITVCFAIVNVSRLN